MRIRSLIAVATAATALTTALVGSAQAQPVEHTPPPNFSGINANNYSGPIPASGSIIQSAPLAAGLGIPNAASSYRILYSTTDQHHKPAVSTGAVFIPQGTAPRGGWPVIAWAHGTVGLGDNCTPSAQPRSDRDSWYLSHWLRSGYAIVATDYAGLGTPGLMSYLNGEAEAYSIADSVKALQQMKLSTARRWAIVGQSQGAGAAMNAAARASSLTHGTDLAYRGVVATGTPANIESVITLASNTFPSVKVPTALTSYLTYILAELREARPDINVNSVLTPLGQKMATLAETQCYNELSQTLAGVDSRKLFSKPFATLPHAYNVLHGYMGTPAQGYDRPIFLGQGLTDTDVPAPSALSLAAQLAANRQPVELHVYPTDHSGTVYASVNDSSAFLRRVLDPQ